MFDNNTLPWVGAAGNFRVVQKEVLKERFVSTVREQALFARDQRDSHFADIWAMVTEIHMGCTWEARLFTTEMPFFILEN